MQTRRIERPRELKVRIPDSSVLPSALDAIAEGVKKKDTRKSVCVESAGEAIKVDVILAEDEVDQSALILEGKLEEGVASTWSTVAPKVKTSKDHQRNHQGNQRRKRWKRWKES